MTLPRIGAGQLSELLPMEAAVDAVEAAFGADRLPDTPLRQRVAAGDGDLLLMPAVGIQGAGVKLVTVTPPNPARGLPLIQGVYVLFAPSTLEPVAVLDGAALTAMRTAAVSGLATRYLAREGVRRLVIFGAGTQGRAHLEAMAAVRPVEEVAVVSRSTEPAERLAARAEELGLRASVEGPDAVADAELICTCTTSATPLFDGSRLSPGAHVNAVGAYEPDSRELDEETVRRGRIVVETREAALEEAGDILIPMKEGSIGPEHIVAELRDVVRGATVRRSEEDVTVFKSVGVALEDLAVARAAVDRLPA